jgi:hypothetical protein
MGTSRVDIFKVIDTKLNYTHSTFLKIEDRGETFLPACFEFLTFNLVFVVTVFFLLMIAGRILRKCRVGKFLRPFSSCLFLAPFLLEGNLQCFFFLLFTQVSRGFSLNWQDKIFTVVGYLLHFLVLWFAIASSFLAFCLRKKLAKYIIDPWRSRIVGLLSYSMANVIRILIFGALHSLLRSHPAQLPLLMLTEASFVVFLILLMSRKRANKVVFKVWLTIYFALIRIALQITPFFQQLANVVDTGNP